MDRASEKKSSRSCQEDDTALRFGAPSQGSSKRRGDASRSIGAALPRTARPSRTLSGNDRPGPARGALAGFAAAAIWAASEPLLQRLFRTPYSDVRLLGGAVTRSRAWPLAGAAIHLSNGAAFGAAFTLLGGRGPRTGVLAAQAENLAAWPLMAAVDRRHPDRLSGRWPPLLWNGRVFAQEATAHAIFGAVLGALARPAGEATRLRGR